MESVKKYNELNGLVTRPYIIDLMALCNQEEQYHLVQNLECVLLSYPDEPEFHITLSCKAKEMVPRSFLYCLEERKREKAITGLGKAVSPSDVYDMITNRMLDLIKKASSHGYKKKWKARVYGKGYTIPFNFESQKRYRGVNLFLLTNFEILENPFFLTFKQIKKYKGLLKKGAKGYPVVYFTKLYKFEQAEPKLSFSTYKKKKLIVFLNENKDKIGLMKHFDAEHIADQSYLPILKYYNVFNGKDIEGIDFDLENFDVGHINNPMPSSDENKLPIAEAMIEHYPDPKPKLGFGGDRAYYSPSSDKIQMPHIPDFDTIQDYYRTLFHEFSHSTGASNRLNRDFTGKFGTKKYAFEELIAEWGAVFLSAEAGIIFHSNLNHAAYLKNWNGVLTQIKDDNKFIMRACTQAQKVADYVLQFNVKGDPKYLKHLKKKIDNKKGLGFSMSTMPGALYTPKGVGKEPEKVLEVVEKGFSQSTPSEAFKANIDNFTPIEEKKEGLPIVTKNQEKPKANQGKYKTAADLQNEQKGPVELFDIGGDLSTFLGKLEIKPIHSLLVTLDSREGGGKTHSLYQWANVFANAGYPTIIWSLEEHKSSSLSKEKAKKYFSPKALNNIVIESENDGEMGEETYNRLINSIDDFEVIMIDSLPKLLELYSKLNVDTDLRKRFNGKLIFLILQRTSSGKARGGSKALFDGDIILKVEVDEEDFRNNYVYNHKNRYNEYTPLSELKYSPYHQKLLTNHKSEIPNSNGLVIESF